MTADEVNRAAWQEYGRHHLHRQTELPEVDRIDWAGWGTGPGTELLGQVAGLRVLDLGSGVGRHAAHLVRDHGATVDAIDASATQHQRARARYPNTAGLTLLHGDAVEHLTSAKPYDLIYAVSVFPFVDPEQLVPAVVHGLRPQGRLFFSTLHTSVTGQGPSNEVAARRELIRLTGGVEIPTDMFVLDTPTWTRLLTRAGLIVNDVLTLNYEGEAPVSYRVFSAHRP
ncbi:class I SAM-dependent methyltransferase [Streptomyces sp. NPDC059835]|uniref:class I SAM-dependent methyltransferase n=1 Tax=Streptomyces sp. NPDC059835 TaxID=3346967 RepID=UPI00364F1E98